MRAYSLREAKQASDKVQALYLNKVEILDLQNLLPHLNQLKLLDISNSKITQWPVTLSKLPKLDTLVLNQIELGNHPLNFPPSLKKLIFTKCNLTSWPLPLNQVLSLDILDLSDNLLTSLPKEIVSLKNLSRLSLSQNLIKKLPKEIGKLKKLKTLDLSQNQLTKLEFSFKQLSELEQLNLSNNQLEQVPQTIGYCHKLTELDISQNQLSSLPKAFFQLHFLRKLILHHNVVRRIPKEISQLNWLSHLDLSNNKLKRIPESIDQCSKLQTLSLAKNQLSSIPRTISALSSLRKLDLSENRLKSFSKLPSRLKSLNLSTNQLKSLPASIAMADMMEVLILDSNQFTKLPKAISKLKVLQDLSLQNLPDAFDYSSLLALKSLEKIDQEKLSTVQKKLLVDIIALSSEIPLKQTEKKALFDRLENNTEVFSQKRFLELLNTASPTLSHLIRKKILQAENSHNLYPGSTLFLLGSVKWPGSDIIKRLEKCQIDISDHEKDSTHYLLGAPPYANTVSPGQKTWVNTSQLLSFMHKKEGHIWEEDQLYSLFKLFNSNQLKQNQLGIGLLQSLGLNKIIWEKLFVFWKNSKKMEFKSEIFNLLICYANEDQRVRLFN